MSLKTKMVLIIAGMVILASVPLTVFYITAMRSVAGMGTDEAVGNALRQSGECFPEQSQKADAAAALTRYQQVAVLKHSVIMRVLLGSIVYCVLIIGIAIGIGYVFSVRITRPLMQLTNATERLAHDDFDVRIATRAGGEVGVLVTAFNAMAGDLKEARRLKLMADRAATWQQVARVIAHEIKNPLTPIKLSIERLWEKYAGQSPDLNAVVASTTTTILAEIDNLQKLVDSFHAYARFPDPVLARASLNTVVRETCALFMASSVPVRVDLDSRDTMVMMDRGQIGEAIINLMRNAQQAIEESGRRGEITVTTHNSGALVELSVTDNGGGITAENQARLFMPYFTTKKQGSGIGLALTERIVTLHNAKISCVSTVGTGTTFTIVFPVHAG